MTISRGKTTPSAATLWIENTQTETVDNYRYLGTVITKDLDINTNYLERASSARRTYVLDTVKHARASETILRITFTPYIKSVLTYHLKLFFEHLLNSTVNKIIRVEKPA